MAGEAERGTMLVLKLHKTTVSPPFYQGVSKKRSPEEATVWKHTGHVSQASFEAHCRSRLVGGMAKRSFVA